MLPHSGVNAGGHQVEARRWVRLDVPSVTRARKVALFWLVRELGPSVVRVGFTVKSLRAGVNYFKKYDWHECRIAKVPRLNLRHVRS